MQIGSGFHENFVEFSKFARVNGYSSQFNLPQVDFGVVKLTESERAGDLDMLRLAIQARADLVGLG